MNLNTQQGSLSSTYLSLVKLSELGVGQKALILQANVELPVKLFEMGCLPGEEVELIFAAPFRDPLCFRVQGTLVSMRQELADLIPITEPHGG
jgi:ferrous iron transport protein A